MKPALKFKRGGLSLTAITATFAVLLLAFLSFSQYQLAFAADNALVSMTLTDTNANGQIDRIVVAIDNDSANTAAIHDTSGWAVTDGGNTVTISAVTFASATNADPLLINVDLDESDSDLTVDTQNSDLELTYTQQGADAGTEYNDGADTQLLTISATDAGAEAEVDGAAPVIKDFQYKDMDYDGKIDRFVPTFSEAVTAASVLSANDLVLTDDGDFNGAAFGTDATDLITGSVFSVNIDLGTEATTLDTNSAATIVITSQNAFSLTDGTNTNTTLAAQSQATYTDGAAPTVKIVKYTDAVTVGDGKVDSINLTFTELLDAASTFSYSNATIVDDGDFNGLTLSSSTVDLVAGPSAALTIVGTASSVVDTFDDSGTFQAGLTGTFSLRDASGNTNGQAELAGSLPTSIVEDGIAPTFKEIRYKDTDGNGKIDRVTLMFTETVLAASVLSANDLAFENVGDFTGAAFGTDATDLITGSVSSVDIDLGTEATAVDTYEDSGDININAQNSFLLSDGSVGSSTHSDTGDTFTDYAAPVIRSVSPADAATNVARNKKITVTFSEAMDTTFDYGTEFSMTNNPGGWSAVWSSNDHVVTLSHTVNFAASTMITVTLDETEIDAASGTPTALATTGPEDETWAFTTGVSVTGTSGGSDAPAEPKTYSLTVLTPNGGEAVNAGNQVEITWETGGTGNQAFVSIAYSIDGGTSYETFATAEINDGSYMWTVPDVTSDQVRVRVIGTDLALALATDASDDNFMILGTEPLNDNQDEGNDNDVAPGTGEMGISPVTGLPEEISEVHAGDVIRGASFDTVYMITDDLRRRPFLTEQIYFTWFTDFDNVLTVTDATLRELELGGPVLPKAGVVLMKLQTDAKVYAIENHATDADRAVKRWIPSEALAISLIGEDWADFVIDVPDTLFARFDEGADITAADSFNRGSMVKRMGL